MIDLVQRPHLAAYLLDQLTSMLIENALILVDIGINVINPVQPDCMDAAAIKREFGDKLALWGTVGTARLWDWGTPDQIRAEVQRRIRELGPQGLLLAPAYDID